MRHHSIINLAQYRLGNAPLEVGAISVKPPAESQYMLRCCVSTPTVSLAVPDGLKWVMPLYEQAERYQRDHVGVRHPYRYITVRHGLCMSKTDDEWHVDGFSTRYHHLPEANYVWVMGDNPTEWADQPFTFPDTFDPLVHNLQLYVARRVDPTRVRTLTPGVQYMMDPYVVHRRGGGGYRTFVRISHTPMEIPDVANTSNPLLPTPHYTRDGVAARSQLLDFDEM